MKYIASVSFGKDSLAMLLLLIEKKYPLDGVVYYDTGMEFESIYNIKDTVKEILENIGIPFYELHPDKPFEYWAFEHKTKSCKIGYGWCGGKCRWATSQKIRAIDGFSKKINDDIIWYVGIAYDEKERYERLPKNKISPLYEWKMTEKDCLSYCYSNGYRWKEDNGIELYSILDRVSCWCCSNKNKKELRNMYLYLPKYWDKLKQFQSKTKIPMKKYRKNGITYGTVFELEEIFRDEVENNDRKTIC